jgi:pyruvate formate lyase activating enzyme
MKTKTGPRSTGKDEDRAQMTSLKTVLSEQVSPGHLYDPMEDRPGWVQCYACGHLCRIPPGRDGICRVRFNQEGTLFVPDGYVGALQCDPVEKKPFFHALPGSLALSFGMLGCDYHCAYCFTGETRVVTNRGVVRIDSLPAENRVRMPDGGEAAMLSGWEAMDHQGVFSPIRQVFRHAHRGAVVAVTPHYLPPFRCTLDHRVFATTDPTLPPASVKAGSLTPEHFLAIPKPQAVEVQQPAMDAAAILVGARHAHRASRLIRQIATRVSREAWEYERSGGLLLDEDAYDSGDGHLFSYAQPRVTTASEDLAYEMGWLALRLGYLPAIDRALPDADKPIAGSRVRQAPAQYTVTWTERPTRKMSRETDSHFLVPIRQVVEETYDGFVYNLEVEGTHTYTANFFAVHNCQNWITSQALRDPASLAPPMATSPEELVALAKQHGAPILASTYNEPLITSEWAVKVFQPAKAAGLVCAYISNGNATPRVLDYLRPWVDLYKVDLKGFDAKRYHELGGVLQTVLETIVNLKQRQFWVEVVTLIVPGFNDSDAELTGIARFLAGVDRSIPWHVTAFHTDYKMTDRPDTSVDTLLRAAEIGRDAGLHFVYAGNRPGAVSKFENTVCPQCGATLIERIGYTVLANHIQDGRCHNCAAVIPGVWSRPGSSG